MKEHLLLFIDLLGTSAAVKSDDDAKAAAIIALLEDVASLRGESGLQPKQQIGRFTAATFRPEVSTFSDCVVISYPLEDLQGLYGEEGLTWGLRFSMEQVARLAAAAMKEGCLLRGGATVGLVHHKGGVVFGRAMLEAYELESRHAIYPRVVVSRKLYSKAKPVPRGHVLLKGDDGITHLNYFTSMVLRSGEVEASRAEWLDRARHIVEENVARFERDERWNELAKWVWFGKQLEQAGANAAPLL